MNTQTSTAGPFLTVALPIHNERDCIRAVIGEIIEVLALAEIPFEIVAVDDGSTDETPAILRELADKSHHVRVVTLPRNLGQSAALGRGIREALGRFICTMDSDGQNDPADIPRCLAALEENGADACLGWREKRRDTLSKRVASKIGNGIRRAILNDGARDTGCSMRVIRTEYLQALQVWRGMHRFLPALVKAQGAKIVQIPVNHRQRQGGKSHYTNLRRLAVTIRDLRGVRWLVSRM
ncbi:MAG: glycosyltransferase family 2 protein [Kiritimatiellaeota bacterium]|nr:glycosyltransferase family 2 protein [Kiritimatiellota bacterium]